MKLGGGTNTEVERNKREHEDTQILDEVVEDAKSFRIFRCLYVDQRSNLRRLYAETAISTYARPNTGSTDLKRDVVVPYPDFQFLLANNILLWPLCIIFSVRRFLVSTRSTSC